MIDPVRLPALCRRRQPDRRRSPCYVVYIDAKQVRDVADALRRIDQAWLRCRFDTIDEADYRGAHDDVDFEYTWDNFIDVQAFYTQAAAAARAVIFTAT